MYIEVDIQNEPNGSFRVTDAQVYGMDYDYKVRLLITVMTSQRNMRVNVVHLTYL